MPIGLSSSPESVPVIITRLKGGLGNQLFQYAAGLRLAFMRNTQLKLDVSKLDDPTIHTPRTYELGALAVTARLASAGEIEAAAASRDGLRARLSARWSRGRSGSAAVERGFKFDPQVLRLPDGVLLHGYWQSERYFEEISDLVRREFAFREPPIGLNAELFGEIAACNSISLHVRRGDYMTNPDAHAMHGVCPLDYYRRAVEYIGSKVSDPVVYLFSDEPEWVRENLQLSGPMRLVHHNGLSAGAEDLRLMSRCSHHIIANSTFSWWGAWLNPSPEKIVIAPKRWFADESLDAADLIPPGWLKL